MKRRSRAYFFALDNSLSQRTITERATKKIATDVRAFAETPRKIPLEHIETCSNQCQEFAEVFFHDTIDDQRCGQGKEGK